MNVLSLFDGISCGRVALDRANIKVDKYYASEIDKYAIQVSQNNYPDIIRMGDINNWESWDIDWTSIDLILAGSPCQGFSFSGKQLAFDDKRSALFFRFAEILSHVQSLNPKVKFLLENVRMKKEFENVITSVAGVNPVMINSGLPSAQDRKRLYWCNWYINQPPDNGLTLKDVAHEWNDQGIYFQKYIVDKKYHDKLIVEDLGKRSIGYIGANHSGNRVHNPNFKAFTLKAACGGGAAKMGQYLFGTYPHDFYIRKLTPIECERLQTLPDNYTQGVSDSQRYKCLGNGWTVDVIAHILRAMR